MRGVAKYENTGARQRNGAADGNFALAKRKRIKASK